MHILLAKWSSVVAWVVTILNICSAIQFFGLLKSITKRLISIEAGKLNLRYGIMSEAIIDISNVESIEISTNLIEFNTDTRKLSPFGELESYNVIIRLNKENTIIGLYRLKKKFKTVVLHVDNKDEFKNQIETLLQQHTRTSFN